jgi:hypothetical protein
MRKEREVTSTTTTMSVRILGNWEPQIVGARFFVKQLSHRQVEINNEKEKFLSETIWQYYHIFSTNFVPSYNLLNEIEVTINTIWCLQNVCEYPLISVPPYKLNYLPFCCRFDVFVRKNKIQTTLYIRGLKLGKWEVCACVVILSPSTVLLSA